jgi:hypothetical protein
MSDERVKEPFEVAKDYTNGFHLTQEDLMEKRKEIYAQIEYLLNMLKQIDYVHDAGADVMSKQEVREYLKLDSIDPRMDVPSAIPKIRMGVGYVYYRKDVKHYLEIKRKGGKQ